MFVNINTNISINENNKIQEINIMKNENIVQSENDLNNLGSNVLVTNEEILIEEHKVWDIEIPAINLVAKIAEGTTKEVMDQYVGHFINTNMFNGNVGLAAHNRGYKVNYFANIKNLQIGDKIIYKTNYGTKTYLVNIITVIEDTDWSYLENTKDNRITLITCVENEPNYRRCIQGIEEEVL